MRTGWTSGLAALAFAAVAAEGAQAQFGDCANADYVRLFDERLTPDEVGGCIELFRLDVSTAEGTRTIRGVQNFNADWAMEPGYAEEVRRGAQATIAALGRIGAFRMDNVTLFLVDDLPPRAENGRDFSNILAMASGPIPGSSTPGMPSETECPVAAYLLAREGADFVAFTIAHEIFHCVQYATASREQVLTLTRGGAPGGDWWVEGSAEWFANLAVPDTGQSDGFVADFNAGSYSTPIHDMAYEAYVFFSWLSGERDLTAITPLFAHMARSPDAASQQAAMRTAIPNDDDWLHFVEAFIDREINSPTGAALALDPPEGDTFRWTEPETQTITLEPFVVTPAVLAFDCGVWTTESRPANANFETRPFEGEWGELPREIDGRDPAESAQVFAGFNTLSRDLDLEIEIEIETSCEMCGGTEEVDSCLVGAWRMTGGGPVEWMRRNMPPDVSIPRFEDSEGMFTLRADGTYWTAPYSYDMLVVARSEDGDMTGEGGGVAQATGRWSAQGGDMNLCTDAQALSGSMTVTTPRTGPRTMPIMNPGPGDLQQSYSCSETSLSTTINFPGMGPMTTHYERIELEGELPAAP